MNSKDIKNVQTYREGLFRDMFGADIKRGINLNFVHYSHTIGKRVENNSEMALGDLDATASIFSASYTRLVKDPSGRIKHRRGILDKGITDNNAQAHNLAKTHMMSSADNLNVVLAWDGGKTKGLSYRFGAGPEAYGKKSSGFVSVKKLVRSFMPEFNKYARGSSPEAFQDVVQKGIKDNATEGALGYVVKSYARTGKAVEDMTTADHLQATYEGIYDFAKANDKLGQFKQIHYNAGVKEVGNIAHKIGNPLDEFGVGVRLKGIKAKSYAAYYSGSMASNTPDEFLGKVSSFWGAGYTKELKTAMSALKSAGPNLAFFIDDDGAIFAGQHGLTESFVPIFSEVTDVDVTERGFRRGFGLMNSSRSVRQSYENGKLVPASRVALREFVSGAVDNYAGITSRNIPKAIRAAFNRQRKILENLTSPTKSRGQFSTGDSLYSAQTSIGLENRMLFFEEGVSNITKAISMQNDVAGAWQALKESTKRNMTTWSEAEQDLFFMVKRDAGQATEGLYDWLIPGSVTEAKLKKGSYAPKKPLEISDPEFLKQIGQSRHERFNRTGANAIRIQPVGLTRGEFRNYISYEKATAEKKLLGRSVNEVDQIYTHFPVVVAFPGTHNKLVERNLYGDAGIRATKTSRGLFENMPGRPLRSFKKEMTDEGMRSFLQTLSGLEDIEGTVWGEAFDKIKNGQQFIAEGRGIEIDPSRLRTLPKGFPKSAAFLNSLTYQERDNAVSFGLSQKGTPGSFSPIIGDLRVTALDTYGVEDEVLDSYGKYADFIASKEHFGDISLEQKIFTHRTGLLGYGKHSTDEFFQRFQATSKEMGFGTDLIETVKDQFNAGYILPKSFENKDNLEWVGQFEKVSRKVLLSMGFTSRQIEGFIATADGEYGLDFLSTGEIAPKSISRNARGLIQNMMFRPKETEEIMNQSKAFSQRLDFFKRWGAGLPALLGMKENETLDKISPVWKFEIDRFEKLNGMKFSRDFLETGISGPKYMIESLPNELKAISAAYSGKEAIDNLNMPILSREEALDIFVRNKVGGLSASQEPGREGYFSDDLKKSNLFSAEARRAISTPERNLEHGFFVDIGEHFVPVSGKINVDGKSQAAIPLRFLPVFAVSSRFGKNLTIGPSGIDKQIDRNSLEAAVLGTLSSLENAAGEKGTLHGTTAEYMADVGANLAQYTKKSGFIRNNLFQSKGKQGSFSSRLTPKAMTIGEALKQASNNISEEDLTVYMEEDVFKSTFGTSKSGRTKYNRALQEMEKHGSVFGFISPNPTHGAAHPHMVKIKLQNRVANSGGNVEPRLLAGAFLTNAMNRDNDKDSIPGAIYNFKDREKAEKAFQRELAGRQPDFQEFYNQMAKDARMRGVNESLDEYLLDVASAKKNKLEHAISFFAFGATPSTAFTMEYPVAGLASTLATKNKSSEDIAKDLNRSIKNKQSFKTVPFSTDIVNKYRNALGQNYEDIVHSYGLMNRIQQNITQAPIQKAGAAMDSFMTFASSGYAIKEAIRADKNYSIEDAQKEATSRAKILFSHLDDLGKFRGFGNTVEEASQRTGALYGAMLHLRATMFTDEGLGFNANIPDIHRRATSNKEGDIRRLLELTGINPEDMPATQEVSISSATRRTGAISQESQKATAAANEKIKAEAVAGSENAKVTNKAKNFLSNNYKTLGVVFGALAGAKIISDLMTDDDMEAPPLTSSRALSFRPVPLPSEPMVSKPQDSYNGPVSQPVGRVLPPSYSMTATEGRASSVNIDSIVNGISMLPIAPDHGTFRIQDDRSYANNWSQSQLSQVHQNSDFIHPYMGSIS